VRDLLAGWTRCDRRTGETEDMVCLLFRSLCQVDVLSRLDLRNRGNDLWSLDLFEGPCTQSRENVSGQPDAHPIHGMLAHLHTSPIEAKWRRHHGGISVGEDVRSTLESVNLRKSFPLARGCFPA